MLSNLGLSYALAKHLPAAGGDHAARGRQPQADMRVRQNFALVLALEGKFKQAEGWRRPTCRGRCRGNVDAIRR